MLNDNCFPFSSVQISLLNLDYCPRGNCPYKTVFALSYIGKTDDST